LFDAPVSDNRSRFLELDLRACGCFLFAPVRPAAVWRSQPGRTQTDPEWAGPKDGLQWVAVYPLPLWRYPMTNSDAAERPDSSPAWMINYVPVILWQR